MAQHREQGFTLIEAAVAIAVVAILSGIIVPLVVKNINDAQIARAKNDVQVIAGALANQLKDTGKRPTTPGGIFCWSTGPATGLTTTPGPALPAGANNFTFGTYNATFNALFLPASTDVTANTLFGETTGSEFSYKGPYMNSTVAAKTDPWGNPYMIWGYFSNGGNTGPIYVISAGPDGIVANANVQGPAVVYDYTLAGSKDDIVVQLN
jgi:general secretion pathway protein G